jgi:DmsE family decaheme c-type cytochrome
MAEQSMSSHHPIREGKMFCSDCHDSHGQHEKNLNAPTVNMVCYKCHAEKQGPFVYEHPPVTENCLICHNPHGTVANNLLRQPATFLCLRCHQGHRTAPNFGPHTGAGLVDVGKSHALQRAFYSDCTQCHSQIHGSDRATPNPNAPGALMR